MAINKSTFETINPSQYITLTFPNPNPNPSTLNLRIAVLDSPDPPSNPKVAAMLVPQHREHDWIFSTQTGHLQLILHFPDVSRLILIGNVLDDSPLLMTYRRPVVGDGRNERELEVNVMPLLLALSPRSVFSGNGDDSGLPEVPFVVYEDDVDIVSSIVVLECFSSNVGEMLVEDIEIEIDIESDSEKCRCRNVGEMLVEDVEIGINSKGGMEKCSSKNVGIKREDGMEKCSSNNVVKKLMEDIEIEINRKGGMDGRGRGVREFRRRLRFRRMPLLVQTQMRIVPVGELSCLGGGDIRIGEMEFEVDKGKLVHPYLAPMVAGLALIEGYLEECLRKGLVSRVLCVGVGGGALLTFLVKHFRFRVFGVESDEMVLRVAKEYFGLVENELLQVCVGDGIELLQKFAEKGCRDVKTDELLNICSGHFSQVDVIMVDLDSSDARNGVSAPPLEFLRRSVLFAAKLALHERGILVVNVIPTNTVLYHRMIHVFREVFAELYEINVENGENYVLIATVSPIEPVSKDAESSILKKLKLIIPKQFIDSIKKL